MKINSTADIALQQIRERKYYQAYELLGKKIILVGIAFDTELNNISEIKYENLETEKIPVLQDKTGVEYHENFNLLNFKSVIDMILFFQAAHKHQITYSSL